ncbi:MAG TPA: hypothetical protein VNX68_05975, partial [Nitrosopumilaceae archaeon]|nr:hypothetical protein [Nitrosopumilaceae archaeon]
MIEEELDEVIQNPLFSGYRKVRAGNKWGLMDSMGVLQIKVNYSTILWAGDVGVFKCSNETGVDFYSSDFKKTDNGESKWKASYFNKIMDSNSSKINSFTWESTGGPFGCDATAFYKDGKGTWWLGTGSSGGVFVSTDEGKTWKDKNNGIGPVHVMLMNKIKDSLLIVTNVSGEYIYASPKYDYRHFQHVYYFNPVLDKWTLIRDSSATLNYYSQLWAKVAANDSVLASRFITIEGWRSFLKNTNGLIYLTRFNKAKRDYDTIYGVIPTDFSSSNYKVVDFWLNNSPHIEILDKDRILLLCRSGLYVANFITKKIEKCGTKGLLATDVSSIFPFSNGDVTIVSGSHAIWKLKSKLWIKISDSYNNMKSGDVSRNDMNFARGFPNKKGERIFTCSGNIFSLSMDGEKVDKLYDRSMYKKNEQNLNGAGWSSDKELFFGKYGKNGSDYFKVYNFKDKKLVWSDTTGIYKRYSEFYCNENGKIWVHAKFSFFNVEDSASTSFNGLGGSYSDSYTENIHYVHFLEGGNMILAAPNDNTYLWNNSLSKWMQLPLTIEGEISCISTDKNGRIYIATNYRYDGGVCMGPEGFG